MRRLATVLFIDMVQSTERASALGDRRWQELLARYHGAVRKGLRAAGGREVDNAGDGFLAVFEAPAQAVACACALTDELAAEEIEIRSGLHMGEVETGGAKPSGIAVHIGARIAAQAGARQVLVSGTLREVLTGSEYGFVDLGSRALKGVPGEWRLYEVTWEDTPRAPAARRNLRPALLALAATVLVGGAAALVALVVLRGPATAARHVVTVAGGLSSPTALALDSEGRVYVADGKAVYRVDGGGRLALVAQVAHAKALAIDSAGDVFIADAAGNRVVKADAGGNLTTVLGPARLDNPEGVAVGFGGSLLIADTGHNQVLSVAPDGTVSVVAGTGDAGYSGDGQDATTAADLNAPTCLAVDGNDNVYIADSLNYRVRRVGVDHVINAVAGDGAPFFSGDGGPGTAAALNIETGPNSGGNCLAVDAAGNLYIADALNQRIRRVGIDGTISTVPVDAGLQLPVAVASEPAGTLYVIERDAGRVSRAG